jgi:hypothetical protein
LGEKEIALIAELDPVVAPAREAGSTKVDADAFSKVFSKLRGKEGMA